MGVEKKYTPKSLESKVKKYFRSISRFVVLTEKKPKIIGENELGLPIYAEDDKGHVVYVDEPIINDLREQMRVLEYIIPPSVGGLCNYLGIHRSTWDRYCEMEEFCDTTTRARGYLHAYLEQESLTRSGKDLKGVLFNLENNYGYKQRIEVESQTLEQWLLGSQGDGGPAF